MAQGSGIEWTDATWNPATGCDKVSPGCKNCYAETMSMRLKAMKKPKYSEGFSYREHENDISIPETWKKSKMIFVNSMSDLFHEQATAEFVAKCFYTMLTVTRHTYQILTKRPARMAVFSNAVSKTIGSQLPSNVWMGTSVEDGSRKERIDDLRNVDCTVRFISFEPLIGPVGNVDLSGIHWAIIGGESGSNFRPVDSAWIRGLISECEEQGVPVFFKQWGGIRPKHGGREINGKTYDGYPEIKTRNFGNFSLSRDEFVEGVASNLKAGGGWTKK